MVCEYLMLLDRHFTKIVDGRKIIKLEQIDKYIQTGYIKHPVRPTDYIFKLKTASPNVYVNGKNEDNLFYNMIKSDYLKDGSREEGSICKFGIGRTDCCSRILREDNLQSMFLKYNMFNLHAYSLMKQRAEYINYTDMATDASYKQIFDNPENLYTKKTDDEIYTMKFIFLCNITIKYIIAKSGRAEGGSKTDVLGPYPPISIIEVLDPDNMVWIVRSERFHLSKSPCVHLGLKNKNITDKLAQFFNLVNGDYRTNVWFHSIAHAVDRLF